jgi:cytochrome P450
MVQVAASPLGDVDLTDLALYARGFPHDVFTRLRRDLGVFWHPATEHTPGGEGFWNVTRHADVLTMLRDASAFSSHTGGERLRGGVLIADSPVSGEILNMMDDPRHARIRRLVSKGFTPRVIEGLETELRRRARALIDPVVAAGGCDFLVDVAAELPMQAICILMGLPESDRHQLAEWVDFAFDFREDADDAARAEASAGMFSYGTEVIADRRANPGGDDLLSIVVHAELPDEDPPRLSDYDLQLFFILLFAAGADTTRNAATGGVLAFAEYPDQWTALRQDAHLMRTAVEEVLRWTSTTAHNRRTATREVTLGGQVIRPGDKVVYWESSANRDETVFEDPFRFDIRRDPNPHLAFGHGTHHCLGASLARLELSVILGTLIEVLYEQHRDLAIAGDPVWTRTNKYTGFRHLPVTFTTAGDRHDGS